MKSRVSVLLCCGALFCVASVQAAETLPPDRVVIKTLSADPARVTGGDVLVEVSLPAGTAPDSVKITAANRDQTAAFQKTGPNALTGLITGLSEGKNTIRAGRLHWKSPTTRSPDRYSRDRGSSHLSARPICLNSPMAPPSVRLSTPTARRKR